VFFLAAAVDDVDDEESEPEAAEECDDDRHAERGAHLALVERTLQSPGRVLDRQGSAAVLRSSFRGDSKPLLGGLDLCLEKRSSLRRCSFIDA